MNNDLIPVGTTVHINPEDIKWEVSGDLISRSALKKSIKSYADDQYAENEYLGEYAIMDIIDNAPTVEPRIEYGTDGQPYKLSISNGKEFERPQGEWLHHEEYTNDRPFYITECPFCNLRVQEETNFCPNCGADMRKGGAEE